MNASAPRTSLSRASLPDSDFRSRQMPRRFLFSSDEQGAFPVLERANLSEPVALNRLDLDNFGPQGRQASWTPEGPETPWETSTTLIPSRARGMALSSSPFPSENRAGSTPVFRSGADAAPLDEARSSKFADNLFPVLIEHWAQAGPPLCGPG